MALGQIFPLALITSICVNIVVFYSWTANAIKSTLKASLTAAGDIPLLGKGRIDGKRIQGTAVICGGSVSGLIAARICSDHFANVIIVEPEAWVATADGVKDFHRDRTIFQKRARVPQYAILHEYQTFLVVALRRLFPNFNEEVKSAGGDFVPSDMKFLWSGIPMASPRDLYPEGTRDAVVLTRPAYETTLRRLVRSSCANVQEITGSVVGVLAEDPSANRLTSVRIRVAEGEERSVPASLVIDCTGPVSAGYKWLQDLYASQKKPSPVEGIKSTYSIKGMTGTYEFTIPDRLWQPLYNVGFPKDYKLSGLIFGYMPDSSKEARVYAVARKEYNILQITIGGWGLSDPFGRLEDLKEYTSKLNLDNSLSSWIYPAIELLEKEQVPFTATSVGYSPFTYVRYHTVSRQLPYNFIALGDSVLQLNPIKGQGVSKGVVEAVTLNSILSKCKPVSSEKWGETVPRNFSTDFFSAHTKRIGILWDAVKADDYAFKTTVPVKGENLESTGKFIRAYASCITRLMLKDPRVTAVSWDLSNWFVPPTDLFSPWIVRMVLWMKVRDLFGL